MKKLLIIFYMLVFGFQLFAKSSIPPVPKPKPSVKWDAKSIDLSSDIYGNQKRATFNFTNTGKTPIKIVSVKFPGYWGPVYSQDMISPGEKGYIELTVLTHDTSKGYGICKVAFSNGESDSLIVYWQKLPAHLKWKTTKLKKDTIYNDKVSTFTFEYTNVGKVPVRVVDASVSDPTTCNYCKDPIMPGKSGYLKVIYASKDRVGAFNKTGFVRFDNGENYRISIEGQVFEAKK